MLWRRASLVFAQGARPSVTAAARDVAEDAAMPPVGCQVVHEKSSPARAVAAVSPFSAAAGTDEQGSGGCVDSGQVTAYIQLMGGPAGAAPKLHQQHQKSQQHKPLSDDGVPLLNISSNSSGKQQHNTATPAAAPHNGRQPSFEEFCRVPSLLGPAALKTGSSGLKLGSLWRAGVNRAASKTSKAQGSRGGSRVSLHNMVPGVDGLLLQPEVVGEVATALGTSQQVRSNKHSKPRVSCFGMDCATTGKECTASRLQLPAAQQSSPAWTSRACSYTVWVPPLPPLDWSSTAHLHVCFVPESWHCS